MSTTSAAVSPACHEAGHGAANRVLIIEDDPVQMRIMQAMTRRLGRRSAGASNVQQARELLRDASFDTVLLDLRLGEESGLDVVDELGARGALCSLILTSACDERTRGAAVRIAQAQGVDVAGALGKPVRLDALAPLLAVQPSDVRPARHEPLSPLGIEDIHAALAAGDIRPAFQPKVLLAMGETVGVEALARWTCQRRGKISPERFVPIIEHAGNVRLLTEAMLAASLAACSRWLPRWPGVSVAVNVSPLVVDHALLDTVHRLLERTGVPPRSLVLEMTESIVLSDSLAVSDVLTRLRISGVQLAIDDFGTGYASLASLLHQPFNELKLDRLFVAGAMHEPDAQRILQAVLTMSRDMGLRCVAEGIESRAVCDCLRGLGCEVGQGWLWSPALTETELNAWLARSPHPNHV